MIHIQVRNRLRAVRQELMKLEKIEAEDVLKEAGEYYLDLLRNSILNSELNLPPLKEGQYSKYRKRGDIILVNTGTYISKLRVAVNKRGTVLAGAIKGDMYDNKISMVELARRIEEGTPDVVPRPHFQSSWEMHKSKVKQFAETLIEEFVKEKTGWR